MHTGVRVCRNAPGILPERKSSNPIARQSHIVQYITHQGFLRNMEICRDRRLTIEKKTIRLPGGTEREKVIVHPNNAVAILPVEGDRCELLKQFRYAVDREIIEAPAGTMEEGEEPLQTAHRELIEETGFGAQTMIPRGFILTTPGFIDEKIFLFKARDLYPSDEFSKDEDE